MSEFEIEYDEKPELSFYSRGDDSREDVHSREASPSNSPAEVQVQAEDEEWKESDLQVTETESDGDLQEHMESDDEERGHRYGQNRRKNRPRPNCGENRPHPTKKRRVKIRRLSDSSSGLDWVRKPECPSQQGIQAGDLWHREHRPHQIKQEFVQVRVGHRTQRLMRELLKKTSDVSLQSDCNFLTQAWEFEENNELLNERCIQECRNADLDAQFYEEFIKKEEIPGYFEMCAIREKLPAHNMKDKIVQLINENQVCFISGGTGCGKTTQIVQFVLDNCIMNMNGSVCNIVCTQPRRVSASSIAQRIAKERLEPLSLTVGYQIRFENKLAERKVGCINFVTTGVLLQWLVTNKLLPQISHIFLDEVHEKTIEFDVIMTLIKSILQVRRNLKVILMSATIDSDLFCKYFDGAPSLEIPGYTFPVEDFYLDDIIKMTNYKVPVQEIITTYDPDLGDFEEDVPCLQNLVHRSAFRILEDIDTPLIAHLIGFICENEEPGAILTFLPGLSDITRLRKIIEGSPWYSSEKHFLVVAHSLMPAEVQKDIFAISPEGKRKIILATSIMETSVTVDDTSYVVDSGKIKFCTFDINLKVSSLNSTWITTANAKQRRGRVGRTKPGKCYKLYSKDQEDNFNPYPPAEMQLFTLEHVILNLKLLKIQQVAPFLEQMMDPPHTVMVELALKELRKMNALDDAEKLTALGYHLSRLPLDVRTGKMILMATIFSCIDPIFSIAACLSCKDPFNVSLDEDKIMEVKESYSSWEMSDHVILSEIIRDWESENITDKHQFCCEKYLSESNMNQISEVKKQFAKVLYLMKFLPTNNVKDPAYNVNSKDVELIKAIVCSGLYPSVATLTRRTKNRGVRTLEGKFAQFHARSVLSESPSFYVPYFVYFHILQTSTKIFIHDATMIEVMPLLLFGKGLEIIRTGSFKSIKVDDELKFKIEPRCARVIKAIRKRLDIVLGRVFLKPGGFNRTQETKEIELITGIVDLIKKNEIKINVRNAF